MRGIGIRTYAFPIASLLISAGFVTAQDRLTQFIPSNSVSHLRVVGDTIWVGSGKGLARTTTRGQSWESFRGVPEFASPGIFAVAVLGNLTWASTGFEKRVNNDAVQTGSGLTYSSDRGLTWRHLPQPTDAPSDSFIQYGINRMKILPVTVPEQNVTFDISLGGGTVWISSFASGLRKSTDNGQTWQRIVLPPDNFKKVSPVDTLTFSIDPRQNLNFRAFSVLALNDSEIWAGTAGGVNKSTDGGVSWGKFNHQNQDSPILANWVIRIKEQSIRGKRRLWTTNWPAEDRSEQYGVSYTDDGGQSWHNLLHDIKSYDFGFRDSIVYIATEEGVYRTDDDGRSWNKASTIIDPNTQQRFNTRALFTVAVQGNTIWVAGEDGVAYTTDAEPNSFGRSWQVLRTYQQVGSTSQTYAYPNPFSPDDEIVRLHYSTGGKDASVKIEIFDFGMNVVRTLLRQAPRSGNVEHDEVWDGRDDSGKQVTNGVYFYKVEVDTQTPTWGKVIVLQ